VCKDADDGLGRISDSSNDTFSHESGTWLSLSLTVIMTGFA